MKPIARALLVPLLIAAIPAPLLGQGQRAPAPAPLSLEHRMMLRCSAAFAMGAHAQASGDKAAAEWPPLAEQGREFFVRAAARVMDKAGLDRGQLSAAMVQEATGLSQPGALAALMPACLTLLPAPAR